MQRRRDAGRGSARKRGYDGAWERVRLQVLERDQYTCHWCGGPAITGDHVIPLALGGARLDPANVVAACGPGNSARSAQARR